MGREWATVQSMDDSGGLAPNDDKEDVARELDDSESALSTGRSHELNRVVWLSIVGARLAVRRRRPTETCLDRGS